MGMTSGGARLLVKGYSHEIEPASIGKADGSMEFIDKLGKISVGGSEVALYPLSFMVMGCTNGADAVGGGSGTVESRPHAIQNGTFTHRDGDVGTCRGFLTSATAGVLSCQCKVRVKANHGGGAVAGSGPAAGQGNTANSSGISKTVSHKIAKRPPSPPKFIVQNSDGSAAASVPVCFRGPDGAECSLVTDSYGEISLNKVGFSPTSATVAENPAKWTPYPIRVNSLERDQFSLEVFLRDFYGRTRGEFTRADLAKPLPSRTIGGVLSEQVSSLAYWIGGSFMGEFNENPTSGQVVLDMMVTMIPVVDQVGDARDITAILLRMRDEAEQERFLNWLSLSTCLIGLIPVLGSPLRGAVRLVIRDFLRTGGDIGKVTNKMADSVFAAIRRLGFGDPKAFLKSIDWARVGNDVVEAYRELGRRAITVIDYLLSIADKTTREFLIEFRKLFVLSGADRQLRNAVHWLQSRMPAWVQDSLERRSKSIFPNTADANEVAVQGNSSMVARLEGRLDSDLSSLKRSTPSVARYLDAVGWRAKTHKILEDRFGDPLIFKLSSDPDRLFKVWNAPSGHLFGTYDELNKLRWAARRRLQHVEFIRVDTKALANARDDRAVREMYDKLRKYDHHHVVEMQDLKVTGAFDENIVFGVKDQNPKLLRERYEQLPCVMVPNDYHMTMTSELKAARRDIGGMTINDLVEEYSEVYRALLNKPLADDVNSIVRELVQAIRSQYIQK